MYVCKTILSPASVAKRSLLGNLVFSHSETRRKRVSKKGVERIMYRVHTSHSRTVEKYSSVCVCVNCKIRKSCNDRVFSWSFIYIGVWICRFVRLAITRLYTCKEDGSLFFFILFVSCMRKNIWSSAYKRLVI